MVVAIQSIRTTHGASSAEIWYALLMRRVRVRVKHSLVKVAHLEYEQLQVPDVIVPPFMLPHDPSAVTSFVLPESERLSSESHLVLCSVLTVSFLLEQILTKVEMLFRFMIPCMRSSSKLKVDWIRQRIRIKSSTICPTS